jgi:hypothetical protein
MAPRIAATPTSTANPWSDLFTMYQGHPAAYFRTHPYKAVVRGAAEIPSELQRIATATPGTLRALGQLQMGERQAPAGPGRALQYLLQQADITSGNKGRVGFHPSDFTAIPGAVGSYVQHQILDPRRLNERVATEPISAFTDLSGILGAPEDAAKLASAGIRGLAARTGSGAAEAALRTAARSPLVAGPRAVTKAAARVGEAINPVGVVARGAGAGLQRIKGTAGMFDSSGAFTHQGQVRLRQIGDQAFPNGELTAADYRNPRFQAAMAPVIARNGFNPTAFKEGVLKYNGATTPRGPITGVAPRPAAMPKTADLIDQGHANINGKVDDILAPKPQPAPAVSTAPPEAPPAPQPPSPPAPGEEALADEHARGRQALDDEHAKQVAAVRQMAAQFPDHPEMQAHTQAAEEALDAQHAAGQQAIDQEHAKAVASLRQQAGIPSSPPAPPLARPMGPQPSFGEALASTQPVNDRLFGVADPTTGVRTPPADAGDYYAQTHALLDPENQTVLRNHVLAQTAPQVDPTTGIRSPTELRDFANSNLGRAVLAPDEATDVRLAAAGHDVLNGAMTAKDPSALAAVAGPLVRAAGRQAWKGATALGGAAMTTAALGGHSVPFGLAHWLPEAVGGVGGYLFGAGTAAHGPGAISQAMTAAQDVMARSGAGKGAPNWLDVPGWTAAATQMGGPAAIHAAPYAAGVGRMDLGVPPAAPPSAPPASDPSTWGPPPPAPVEPDLDKPGAGSAPDTAPAAESPAAEPPSGGKGHAKWSPPKSDLSSGASLGAVPDEPKPVDLDAQPSPQADGGRVERAAGGQVGAMTEHLLKRAEQAQKAAQTATKPLLGLSDDTVAQALRVAQRAI